MRRCGVMCFHGAVAALILLAAGGGASAPAATAAASAGSAASLLPGACRSGDNLQLRGGFEAAPFFKPTNLGQPNAWSGQNIGPKEKRMKFLHAKARPAVKVQSRWYIDCTRPVGDKLIDINDLERYLRDNIKVQGKTGNLAAGKLADQPRVTVYVEKSARLIMQSYIPVAKRYIKYLIKNYLHKRGLRDFVWCVAAGKASYKLKYYNIEDIKSAASAPTHDAAAAAAAAAATTDGQEGADAGEVAGDEKVAGVDEKIEPHQSPAQSGAAAAVSAEADAAEADADEAAGVQEVAGVDEEIEAQESTAAVEQSTPQPAAAAAV